ncbi:penicillin-binding protein 2 [Pandoraea sp.]|uniref:peptidoglycan D,D-transpeptidase FtsI family protein n=1 Tax=Pandoraea sp. TaxID=1883445 RepID=UPI00120970AE|nr:penicillin-binding protein 2 [Pandoraea sp.]TAL55778.1 MAG: penicillin-binding protein 2 [Pandoraea sp.]TAM19382.1 MAG: penicillin-binding protein 2 [Pandoraea sp.]
MKSAPQRNIPLNSTPILNRGTFAWRSRLVVAFITLAFIALAVRAFWIQGPGNAFYIKQGEMRYEHQIPLPAVRGRILDRDGRILAVSLPADDVWANPVEVPKDKPLTELPELAKLLGENPATLRAKLTDGRKFIYLKRLVTPAVGKEVLALKMPGVHETRAYKRFYPEGEIAAHVVGFTNVEDQGQEGIELGEQSLLKGTGGSHLVIEDRLGRIIQDLGDDVAPRDGKNVVLSLDTRIQLATYMAVKDAVQRTGAKAGAAVVLDAKYGQVLALANYPSYNPNDREDLTGDQLRNRVLTDSFEPGSILKPVTMALALQLHRVTPTTTFDTGNGRLEFHGAVISDDSPNHVITTTQIITKSSNIGMTKISTLLKPEEMWNMFTDMGLGQAPKLGFPGASAGRVRPYHSWRPIEQATMAYGYGISTSLFQLARAYSVFANHGVMVPISIFKNTEASPPAGVRIISTHTAQEILDMLETVVQPGGTAPTAQVPGYRVGGKTGTAYKLRGHTYDHSLYRASFVGIAPLSNPRLVIAVSIDQPRAAEHFGGQAAAPAFVQIASQALPMLNILPDNTVKPTVMPADASSVQAAAPAAAAPRAAPGHHG